MISKPFPSLCCILSHLYVASGDYVVDPTLNIANGEDKRNNYCDLYDKINQGKLDRKDALNGVNVSIGVLPDVLDKKTGELNYENVIALKVFEEVARLAKFNYKDLVGVVDFPKENETYTDKVSYIVNHYDVAVSWWIRTLDRASLGISGAEGWYDASTIMIRKVDNFQSKTSISTALKPFDWSLWLSIIFTGILTGVIYNIIDYLYYRGNKKEREHLGDNIFKTFLTFLGNPTQDPIFFSNRLVLFSSTALSVVFIAIYTANLAATLVNENKRVTFNTFQEAIKYDYRFCVWKGSGDVVAIQYDYPTVSYEEKETELEIYQGIVNGECEIGLVNVDRHNAHKKRREYNPDCRIEVVGVPVRPGSASFALKSSIDLCSSVVRDVLDFYLLQMIEDKTLDRIKASYFNAGAEHCNSNKNENETSTSFTPYNLIGVFVFHYSILIIALIFEVLQIKYPKMFVEKLHEISIVRKVSLFIKNKICGCLTKDLVSKNKIELRAEESGVDDVGNELVARDIQKDQMIKEFNSEVIKIRNDMQNMKSELMNDVQNMKSELMNDMQNMKSELMNEIKKLQ